MLLRHQAQAVQAVQAVQASPSLVPSSLPSIITFMGPLRLDHGVAEAQVRARARALAPGLAICPILLLRGGIPLPRVSNLAPVAPVALGRGTLTSHTPPICPMLPCRPTKSKTRSHGRHRLAPLERRGSKAQVGLLRHPSRHLLPNLVSTRPPSRSLSAKVVLSRKGLRSRSRRSLSRCLLLRPPPRRSHPLARVLSPGDPRTTASLRSSLLFPSLSPCLLAFRPG